MSTDENKPQSSAPPDPDLNEEDFKDIENFDEPFPRRPLLPRRPDPNTPAGRASTSLENGLGNFFRGLSEVANFITDLAEKTEQAAKQAAERRQAASGEFRPQTNDRGFASRWGLNNSIVQNRPTLPPPLNNRPLYPPAPVLRADAPPPPQPSAPDLTASTREPYLEIHDEAEEGIILVIAELPGLEEAYLRIEVLDDILIVSGEGPDIRYEKEILLPAIVQPEPQNRTYQNGVLELRLKKI